MATQPPPNVPPPTGNRRPYDQGYMEKPIAFQGGGTLGISGGGWKLVGWLLSHKLHPGKLTWNLKMNPWRGDSY